MGTFFGASLLLVEGDDELRIWSQVPRPPGAPKLAIFQCRGRPHMLRYQRVLERLFGAMLDDSSGLVGFVLVAGRYRCSWRSSGETGRSVVTPFAQQVYDVYDDPYCLDVLHGPGNGRTCEGIS